MADTSEAWRVLNADAEAAKARSILSLFETESGRLEGLTVEAAGLTLDVSKQPWSMAGFVAGVVLARLSGVEAKRTELFSGAAINTSEDRAVMHPALRAAKGADFWAKGEPVSAEVEQVRGAIKAFADGVRSGAIKGASGQRFEAIVHIGIGGSDLGPRLIWEALKPLKPGIALRFAANVDGSDIAQALEGLDPATTLVTVVSKTFTTQETMANAKAARDWLRSALHTE